MRFRKATISGFGGVSKTATLDLDAGVVILLGSNGFGKSTVCDAIVWALTGCHPRDADPRSWYGSGETFVELEVVTGPARAVATIRRLVANPGEESAKRLKTSVVVRDPHRQLRGAEAERWIMGWLQNSSSEAEDEADKSGSALTDTFYLQQDSLRDFLADRSDDERFAALSQMVGARALSDLLADFESACRAWTKSVGKESEDVERLRSSLDEVRADIVVSQHRLEQMRAVDSGAVALWAAGATSHLGLGTTSDDSVPYRHVNDLFDALERRIESRTAQASQLDRRLEQVGAIDARLSDVVEHRGDAAAVLDLEERLQGLELAREQAANAVEDAQAHLQAAQTRNEELRALAELALRHVSETCPTCGQGVDPAVLVARLNESIGGSLDAGAIGEGERLALAYQARDGVISALRTTTSDLEQARLALELDRQAQAQRQRDEHVRAQVLNEIEQISRSPATFDLAPKSSSPTRFRAAIASWVDQANDLVTSYQAMEPALAQSSTAERVTSLQSEEGRRQAEYLRALKALERRQQTQSLAESFLRALKRDSENFLNDRLRSIQPILDQLYAAIDPHPTLRGMLLETRNWYGKNRLSPVLVDSTTQLRVEEPGRTLSTSQANALAVTLFLAFNLGLQPTQVSAVILDDPLQNLDDVHLLGLVDLLRRVQPHRQVIVTTHDTTFASLLARKMRPIDSDDRLAVIRFDAWDREGPRIVQEHPAVDPQPMKLVAG